MDAQPDPEVTLWTAANRDAMLAAQDLLRHQILGTFAVSLDTIHCWTAYFAWDGSRSLVMLTSPLSRHGRVLIPGTDVSACIHRPATQWGDPIAGLQLAGTIQPADQRALQQIYSSKFGSYAEWIANGGQTESTFFSLQLRWMKVVDESRLGEERFFEIGERHE